MLNKTKEEYKEIGKCCICKGFYFHYGNNAQPLKKGRCCDTCNSDVILARMKGERKVK
jgi:hypothetical protein